MFDFDHSGTISFDEFWYVMPICFHAPLSPCFLRWPLPYSNSTSTSTDNLSALWAFLSSWRHLFDRFDIDHSGTISPSEFASALTAFGYRLSPAYVRELFEAYDVRGRGVLSFDMFVQACISLKRMVSAIYRVSKGFRRPWLETLCVSEGLDPQLSCESDFRNTKSMIDTRTNTYLILQTDVFKKYDEDRDGFITLSL